MANAFKHYGLDAKDKALIEAIEDLGDKLDRIIELLEGQGRVRPS